MNFLILDHRKIIYFLSCLLLYLNHFKIIFFYTHYKRRAAAYPIILWRPKAWGQAAKLGAESRNQAYARGYSST
jgi:hypothetical protein